MRTVIVGLGIQGKKRMAVAGPEVVATVDPIAPQARYRVIDEVPLETFDRALVCTPDETKPALLTYLLSHGKHVLVEKPLLASQPNASFSFPRIPPLASVHRAETASPGFSRPANCTNWTSSC